MNKIQLHKSFCYFVQQHPRGGSFQLPGSSTTSGVDEFRRLMLETERVMLKRKLVQTNRGNQNCCHAYGGSPFHHQWLYLCTPMQFFTGIPRYNHRSHRTENSDSDAIHTTHRKRYTCRTRFIQPARHHLQQQTGSHEESTAGDLLPNLSAQQCPWDWDSQTDIYACNWVSM